MKRVLFISVLASICLPVVLGGCGCTPDGAGSNSAAARPLYLKASEALSAFDGEVLVLLMGKSGCTGTERAMPFITEYNRTKPEGVSVARLDVPPAGKTIRKDPNVPVDLHYDIDKDRQTAEAFDFFFYPTLLVFDRDGVARFRGGCDPDGVKKVVAALMAEEQGAPKFSFNAAVPGEGSRAVDFSGETIDGKQVSFSTLRGESSATLLIFSSTNCPFSKKAMGCVNRIAEDFEKKGASVVIVNSGSGLDVAYPFYSKTTPGIPVLVDEKNEISGAKYGVQVVPFFFAIDGEGVIVHRMPFDDATAREALDSALGLSTGPVKVRAKGAG